jgi:hypothetical protein
MGICYQYKIYENFTIYTTLNILNFMYILM